MPRIALALAYASSGPSASFTPPALPRPPTFTCAFTTTSEWPSAANSAAISRACSAVVATLPGWTGMPYSANSSFAWYSNRSTGGPFWAAGFVLGSRRVARGVHAKPSRWPVPPAPGPGPAPGSRRSRACGGQGAKNIDLLQNEQWLPVQRHHGGHAGWLPDDVAPIDEEVDAGHE